ncbi:hypothetical protein [Idiomarina abyssalis]|uniref:Toxin co-regulated pilus biosynthesis protein Q C-terminal domain-containing protein n=1 Tax=Idiomarina abyssalis TaxID=86102 RepID=A0A8I1KHF3_9GAMM|nr:hypothetical protein [Idiomarina abyssalis]MBJ7265583.1 hypothetical protein [Idiomarina abyssalis]MBJ7316743.1 hypothetical protein [Idiomarina abyssalis]
MNTNIKLSNNARYATAKSYLGIPKVNLPSSLFFIILIGYMVRQVAGVNLIYIGIPVIAIHWFQQWSGVGPGNYLRAIKARPELLNPLAVLEEHFSKSENINTQVRQMNLVPITPKYKKRSRVGRFLSLMCALLLVSGVIPQQAKAQMRLILPDANSNKIEVESNQAEIPMITEKLLVSGYGIDAQLEKVLQQLIPKTFEIRFRNSALKTMPVSWRSQNDRLVTVLASLVRRYGIAFRYSNESGIVYVEYPDSQCEPGLDDASVYRIIC